MDDTIAYTYDDLGRVSARNMASVSYPNHAHGNTYTFDSLGRRKQDINGLATYDYTFIGNSSLVDKRSSAASTGVREVDYDYFTHAEIPYLNRPLKNIVHRSSPGGTVISRHDYTYGLAHELAQIKTWQRQLPNSGGGSTTTTQTFGYDNILQLTSAAETRQATKTYGYDAAGNRTSKAENGSSTTYVTANDVNQIASATGGDPHSSATYDVNGNLQSITYGDNSKRTMIWDTINRLKEITIQAGAAFANGDKKVTWDYNADSQRYKEMAYTHNGSTWVLNSTVYFIWEDGSIIQKRIGGTTAYSCTNYFQEGDMRCLNNAAPTKYYYTRDHLGSVYEMTNTAAAVQAAYSYVAYGERTKRWGAQDTEIAYTGHWNFKPASFAKQAAADLSLTWFRAYDPKRGVWLGRDPMGEEAGFNLYQMVSNNTINWIDRLGLSAGCPEHQCCENGKCVDKVGLGDVKCCPKEYKWQAKAKKDDYAEYVRVVGRHPTWDDNWKKLMADRYPCASISEGLGDYFDLGERAARVSTWIATRPIAGLLGAGAKFASDLSQTIGRSW